MTKRRTFYEDDKNNHSTKELLMVDPIFQEYLKNKFQSQILKFSNWENLGTYRTR